LAEISFFLLVFLPIVFLATSTSGIGGMTCWYGHRGLSYDGKLLTHALGAAAGGQK